MNKRWQKLQNLFHQAQQLPADAIKAYLDKQCGDDSELRNEIEEMLKLSSQDNPQLTEQIIGAAHEMTLDTIQPDTRIGAYKIISELGKGGMGTVYLAERADESYQQKVAIKLISSHKNTEEITKRFIAERQILARLTHPNIARLLDGGTTKEGSPYFAMEYIKGEDIIHYSNNQRLSIKQRIKKFIAVCAAVNHAHRQLILHRDIKPPNILISEDGQPKLLDFGIAKLINPENTDVSITGDQLIMTPEYASPEQVLGQNLSVATDIYQLGLVLYQLLTGENAQKIKEANVAEIKDVVIDSQPISPSNQVATTNNTSGSTAQSIAQERSTQPSKLVSKLKGDLDTIVLKCLHKDPELRYLTVKDLSDDLEAYLNLRPIKARGLSKTYRFKRFIRRHWLGVTATSITALALVAGLTFSLISLEQTKQAERKAEAAAQRAKTEANRAETEAETANQVSQFLIDMITEADPRESGGKEVTVKHVLENSLNKIHDLDDQPIIQIKLMHNIGNAFTAIGLHKKSQKLLENSLNLAEKIKPIRHDLLINSLGLLSDTHLAQGNNKLSLSLTTRAIQIARKNNLVNSSILIQYQEALGANDKFDSAILAAEEALKLLSTQNSDNSIKTKVHLLALLARLVETNGDIELGEKYIKEGLDLLTDKPAFLNRKLMLLISLGTSYTHQERYHEAEDLMHEALSISKRVFGEEHVENIRVYLLLGRNQLRLFNIDDANFSISAGMRIANKTVGKSHPAYIQLLEVLANIRQVEGNYLESLMLLQESTEIANKKMGEKHGITLVSKAHQVPLLLFLGRILEAEKMMDQLFNDFSKLVPPDHPFMMWIFSIYTNVSLKAGNLVKADEMAKKLLTSTDKKMIIRGVKSLIQKEFLLGDLEVAKKQLLTLDHILAEDEKRHDNLNHHQANYLNLYSEYLLYSERFKEALETINVSIQILEGQYPKNHPKILLLHLRKAKYLSLINHHEEAINLSKNTINHWLKFIDKKENSTAILALSYADILIQASKNTKAIELLQQHIPTLEKSFASDHYQLLRANCLLGRAFIQNDQRKKGQQLKTVALKGLQNQLGVNSPLYKDCQKAIMSKL